MGMKLTKDNEREWLEYIQKWVVAEQWYAVVASPTTGLFDIIPFFTNEGEPLFDEQEAYVLLRNLYVAANSNTPINRVHLTLNHRIGLDVYKRYSDEWFAQQLDNSITEEQNETAANLLGFLDKEEN